MMGLFKPVFTYKRSIPWLCHFTPRENLVKIKKEGLCLRDEDFMAVTDTKRFDGNNYICLSVSQPNKWMFEHKKNQGFDLCLILIDASIINVKKCNFYPYNAATKSYRGITERDFSTLTAFDKMFADEVIFSKANSLETTIHRDKDKPSYITTTEQSEIQVKENIESKYILHVFEKNIPLTFDEIKKSLVEGNVFFNNGFNTSETLSISDSEIVGLINENSLYLIERIEEKDTVDKKTTPEAEIKITPITHPIPRKIKSSSSNNTTSTSGCLILVIIAVIYFIFK